MIVHNTTVTMMSEDIHNMTIEECKETQETFYTGKMYSICIGSLTINTFKGEIEDLVNYLTEAIKE